MSIKVALCYDHQLYMTQVQALIYAHPQGALFEVTCFPTIKELLNQPVVYDLLITDIKKASGENDGLKLSSQMTEKTKIVIFSFFDQNFVYEKMAKYTFELFECVEKTFDNRTENVNQILEKYLAWQENPRQCQPFLPKILPPPQRFVTIRTDKQEEVTLCLDDILYLSKKTRFFVTKTTLITTQGNYILKGGFDLLPKTFKRRPFYAIHNKIHLVNLDRCRFDKLSKKLILAIDQNTTKIFPVQDQDRSPILRYYLPHRPPYHISIPAKNDPDNKAMPEN